MAEPLGTDRPVPRVFVCYRRSDASAHVGRLSERLSGLATPFMDTETIEPGIRWRDALEKQVHGADVVLAVIGPTWLGATDEQGRRLLDDPDDFVRHELEVALASDVPVIPVLVDDASMPPPEALPESLAALAERSAVTLREESYDADIDRLVRSIEDVARVEPEPSTEEPTASEEPASSQPGDSSLRNRASLVALIEVNGRSMLFTGDSDADTLAKGLRRLCNERGVRRLSVDVFVVPHNGSRRNLDRRVLELVEVDTFAICTDGSHLKHPDHEVVELIGSVQRGARIAFNYASSVTERWMESSEQDRVGIAAVFPTGAGAPLELQLD